MSPIEKALRAYIAFSCELRGAFTGPLCDQHYQIEHLVRRSHDITLCKQNE